MAGAFAIDNSGLITVANKNALDYETTPVFNLTVLVDDGNNGTDTAAVTVNLTDLQAAVSIDDDSAAEGDAGTTHLGFTISLTGDVVNVPFDVGYATTDDLATTSDNDYVQIVSGLAAFAGTVISETQPVSATASGDEQVEVDETFFVNLTGIVGTNDVIIADGKGEATIENDDSATVSIGDVSATEGGSLVFSVSLAHAVDVDTVITYSTADGSATTTDYTTQTAQTLTIPTGQTSGTINIATTADTQVEVDETFDVNLTAVAASGRNVTILDGTGEGTILNDDSALLTVADVTVTEGTDAGATTLTFFVTVDAAVQGGFDVDFSSALGTAEWSDFTITAASPLSFEGTAGETQTIEVDITRDAIVEDNETFTITLGDVTATTPEQDANIATGDSATATIDNDDSATLSISAPAITEADVNQTISFVVTLDTEVEDGFDVAHSLTLGTAEGSDLSVVTASPISFAGTVGETQNIDVTIVGDDIVEDNETFTITLGDVTPTTPEQDSSITTGAEAAGSINNDDQATITIDDVTVVEGQNGTVDAVFTVTLDSQVDVDATVGFATADDTAQDQAGDNDYLASTGFRVFDANSLPGSTQTIPVTVNGDILVEPHQTYFMNLVSLDASGRNVILADDQGLGTILNDDFFTGLLFDDLDDDGVSESADGEAGIEGVLMQLVNEGSGTVVDEALTGSDGRYAFDETLGAGTYKIVEVVDELVDLGLLDGIETAGVNKGGVVNSRDSNEITGIDVSGIGSANAQAVDYLFAEIRPSNVFGMVWRDFNNDRDVNFGEAGIDGVIVELTGLDDRGNSVSQSATTANDGSYAFINLRPGTYTLKEIQPAEYDDGLEGDYFEVTNPHAVNQPPAVDPGTNSGNDVFGGIRLAPETTGDYYNFGERPQVGGDPIGDNVTATIGFWHNKNGQALIESLNGDANSTQLGDWLAATFPTMYGEGAIYDAAKGDDQDMNLAGKTNADVAGVFMYLFQRNKKTAVVGGPPKVDAQVMAVALATYVTSETLAGGDYAAAYGFNTSADGIAYTTFNVLDMMTTEEADDLGLTPAMDVAGNVRIIDILLATNEKAHEGLLYDADDSGAISSFELILRMLANELYTAINEGSDI